MFPHAGSVRKCHNRSRPSLDWLASSLTLILVLVSESEYQRIQYRDKYLLMGFNLGWTVVLKCGRVCAARCAAWRRRRRRARRARASCGRHWLCSADHPPTPPHAPPHVPQQTTSRAPSPSGPIRIGFQSELDRTRNLHD